MQMDGGSGGREEGKECRIWHCRSRKSRKILHLLYTLALKNLTILIVDDGKYATKYDECVEIEVSWSPVLLGRNTFNHISYYTMQDQLIFQSSEELPGNTTSTTVAVRDPHPGLQHVFTVRTVVKAQDTTYEGSEATAFIVFGQYHIYV